MGMSPLASAACALSFGACACDFRSMVSVRLSSREEHGCVVNNPWMRFQRSVPTLHLWQEEAEELAEPIRAHHPDRQYAASPT